MLSTFVATAVFGVGFFGGVDYISACVWVFRWIGLEVRGTLRASKLRKLHKTFEHNFGNNCLKEMRNVAPHFDISVVVAV